MPFLPRHLSGQRFTLSHDRSVSIKENVRQPLFDESDTVNTIMFVCKQSRNWNRSRLTALRHMATFLPSVHFLKNKLNEKKSARTTKKLHIHNATANTSSQLPSVLLPEPNEQLVGQQHESSTSEDTQRLRILSWRVF